MTYYYADIISWSDHETIRFKAENAKEALHRATNIAGLDFPEGYDLARLWGEGKLLWESQEGWLPEHEAF